MLISYILRKKTEASKVDVEKTTSFFVSHARDRGKEQVSNEFHPP